jgi:hypothetical protein
MYDKAMWYREGVAWIGALVGRAADHFEQAAGRMAELDPRARRQADEYLEDVRVRAHLIG